MRSGPPFGGRAETGVLKTTVFSIQKRKRVRAFPLACALFFFVSLVLAVPWVPTLTAVSEDEILFERAIGPLEFEIAFRHSYNRGLIREMYRIAPDKKLITLSRGCNQSFGAGMLDTAEAVEGLNFRQEGEWFVMDFPPAWKTEVRYIGGAIAGHELIYGNSVFSFGKLHTGRALIVRTQRRSPLQKLLHFASQHRADRPKP